MGAPKALLSKRGETAVARVVRVAREAGCDPVVVVAGGDAARVRAEALLARARVAENPEWERGRTGSAKRGISAAGRFDAALVWPVDHPDVEAATLSALLAAFDRERAAVIVPTLAGKRGHPILLRADVAVEVAKLADDAPLRDVVAREPARVVAVEVADAGVLANVDTPEDAARAGWTLTS